MLGILVPRSSPMPYICDDLMELIFLMIDPSRTLDRLNLIKTNRHLYNKYYKEYSNTVAKMKIYKTLNNNYLAFYRFLNTFSYSDEYKRALFTSALRDTPIVWYNRTCGINDLRYIFELMYNGAYVDIKTMLSINEHLVSKMYGKIQNSIYPGDRQKTKAALDKNDHLKSLHSNFIPFRKSHLMPRSFLSSNNHAGYVKYDNIK